MTYHQNINEPEQTRAAGTLLQLEIAGETVCFRWAPPGNFLMGSPEDEEAHLKNETLHEVTLTQGFWIADTLTTQALWHSVTGRNPFRYRDSVQLPVDVSWESAQLFLKDLNENFSSVLPSGYKYAMPTEAQWEYACRAGTTTPYNFGESCNGEEANCNGNYPYGTYEKGPARDERTQVGSFPPNNWGLYDMHGNLWECCSDWYGWDYYKSPDARVDPTGPSTGKYRVARGGNCYSYPAMCRSAFRCYATTNCEGLRMVLAPCSVPATDD